MSRAAMQQALEALELGRDYAEGERLENERRYKGHEHLAPDDAYAVGQIDAAIAALRAALAQQAEPAARSLTEDERAAIEYFALNPSMAVLAFSHWLRRDKSALAQQAEQQTLV